MWRSFSRWSICGLLLCLLLTHCKQDLVLFDWDATENDLIVTLEAPTRGWVAIGFDSTETLEDANLIIGFVKNRKVYLRDDFAVDLSHHRSDRSLGGDDNVKLIDGSEKRGTTRISFSIPLKSGDPFDPDILMSRETVVFLAYGREDDFDSLYTWTETRHTEFELTIPDCCFGG